MEEVGTLAVVLTDVVWACLLCELRASREGGVLIIEHCPSLPLPSPIALPFPFFPPTKNSR